MEFGFGIVKNYVRKHNQLLEDTMYANFQAKWRTWTFLTQTCPKINFRSEFWKPKCGCRIRSFKIRCMSIFRQNGKLWLFRPKFAPKWIFWPEVGKVKSGCRICSSKSRYYVCQFLGKTDNYEFFCLVLEKFPNYVPYFGSYNVEGVPERCVEAETSWVEEDGWRLKWAGWRWMEVNGGGWMWIKVGGGGCMV